MSQALPPRGRGRFSTVRDAAATRSAPGWRAGCGAGTPDDPDLAGRILRAQEDERRRVARELHLSIVEDLGLAAATGALRTRVAQREKAAIPFVQTGEDDSLPRETAVCLYRVLQEGLRNATRHARATQVTVTLAGDERDASLRSRSAGISIQAGFRNVDRRAGDTTHTHGRIC